MATLASDTCGSLMGLSHILERYANARLPSFGVPSGLTMPRVRLMLAVSMGMSDQISTRMSDIALDLGVTARTITTMVDALERDGLVERVPDVDDRRAISLVLTDDGQAAVEQIMTAFEDIGAAFLSPLSGSEQMTLNKILLKLVERDGS
jgi:DNA-binding MarR family transcriptional regulator